jgi:hypothetical protein
MTTRYFGAPIARNEDRRLLTGRALFVNDVERPGMLHVAFCWFRHRQLKERFSTSEARCRWHAAKFAMSASRSPWW